MTSGKPLHNRQNVSYLRFKEVKSDLSLRFGHSMKLLNDKLLNDKRVLADEYNISTSYMERALTELIEEKKNYVSKQK